MPSFSIESNGRIEKTAVYFNGDQIAGIKEVLLYMSEDGTFDAVIQYEGSDDVIHNKQIFTDYWDNVKTMPAAFTEEEAQQLHNLTVDSSGEIESSVVTINGQPLDGITGLHVHIKAPGKSNVGGIRSLFTAKEATPERAVFQAEITFRNEDGSLTTEAVF